jgi:YD repeat-containing protein
VADEIHDPNANNGNLLSHVTRRPGLTWTQSFTYDGVNRLLTASETNLGGAGTWNRTYDYDQSGNRWTTIPTTNLDIHEPSASTNYNAANRLIIGTTAAHYDNAGNQLFYDPFTITYDAENRITSATSAISNVFFTYDGDGRRVKKVATGGTPTSTYYLYDVLGQLAAEYSDPATAATGTSWIHTDMLGSTRMVTGEKPTGSPAPVQECNDYMPFGETLGAGNQRPIGDCYPTVTLPLTSRLPQKFTGKERDAETGLDFSAQDTRPRLRDASPAQIVPLLTNILLIPKVGISTPTSGITL